MQKISVMNTQRMVCIAFVFLLLSVSGAGLSGQTLRVASVQMPVTGDIPRNLAYMKNAVDEAAAAGARVIVFPETVLSGFFEEDIRRMDTEILRKAMDEVARLAARYGVYIVYGTATPSPYERPYNSALVINPQGECMETYHKSFPENHFEPGEKLALFSIEGIPATLIICHDSRYPELVRVPVMAGARICFYVSYEVNSPEQAKRKREGYHAQSVARAAENGIWYIQANGVGPFEGDRISLGNSIIVNSSGVVVAKAPEMEPAIIYADVEVDMTKPHSSTALRGQTGKLLGGWNKSALEQMMAQESADEFASKPKADNDSLIRLALMQGVPVKWDMEANFNTFLKFLDDAHGADVFITPECWLDGYAAPDKTSSVEKLKEVAQDINSSHYLKRVSEEAAKRRMYICFGFTSIENGKIYNAAGLWDKTGKLVGIYHKTHLQTHDLQYAAGEELPVWNTSWGPIGTMICADRRWPETARTLRLKGARLILNPTYGMHHLDNEWWMRTRSYENQCFIAFAHPSVGFVVGPRGNLIAKRTGNPGVLICDIDITLAKNDGHIRDRRPDIYFRD